MELREVIGRGARSASCCPHKPVELEKIQCMLEAARLASHWGNINSLRAIVIERDNAPQDVIDALPSPVGGYQIQLAPVVIVWYIETTPMRPITPASAPRAGRLRAPSATATRTRSSRTPSSRSSRRWATW